MGEVRSLNSPTISWKRKFLGALGATGLRLDIAVRLLENREAMREWVALAAGCLDRYGQGMSDAKRKRHEFAAAAAEALRWRVDDETTIEEMDLTIRTYNLCDSADLRTVGAVLGQETLPTARFWTGQRVSEGCEELRNRLTAGGTAEPRLPEWLKSPE